jgi:hypothetical protein
LYLSAATSFLWSSQVNDEPNLFWAITNHHCELSFRRTTRRNRSVCSPIVFLGLSYSKFVFHYSRALTPPCHQVALVPGTLIHEGSTSRKMSDSLCSSIFRCDSITNRGTRFNCYSISL